MKRKTTAIAATGALVAISALLALAPGAVTAQSGGNPWNPYRTPKAQTAPQPAPVYVAPVSGQQPQTPSRFAPQGLEQQLASAVRMPAPAPTAPGQPAPQAARQNATPPTYAPPAPESYGSVPSYGRRGYGASPYAPAQTYGGYPQAYGGYPQGYSGYVPQGYNALPGYGYPGGLGGFGPFPGNFANGGVPGFNFMPFGLF